MYKRILSLISAAVLAFGSFGCSAKENSNSGETVIELSNSSITVNGSEISADSSSDVYLGNNIIYYEENQGSSYGEGTKADEYSEEEALAHKVINITKAGTYKVSGTLENGQIFIDLGEDAKDNPESKVTLILSGADITCTVAPAVLFYNVYECSDDTLDTGGVVDTSDAGANVIIEDDTINYINGSYVAKIYEPGTDKKLHKYDGTFYSRMSMNIGGGYASTGVLYVTAENEGIDSELHLTVNGANIFIESQNDGINTNEDGISVTTVNGGYLYVNGGLGEEGDGIDSNGYITINGGTVIAVANEKTGDGGIDADGKITVNGGKVIAQGGRNEAVDSSSAQNFIELSFKSVVEEGSSIKLVDENDEEIINYTADRDLSSLTLSDPALKLDTVYRLYVNDILQQYTGNGFGFGRGQMPPEDGEDRVPPEGIEDRIPGEKGDRPDFEGAEGMKPQKGDREPFDNMETTVSTEFIITAESKSFSGVSPWTGSEEAESNQ